MSCPGHGVVSCFKCFKVAGVPIACTRPETERRSYPASWLEDLLTVMVTAGGTLETFLFRTQGRNFWA